MAFAGGIGVTLDGLNAHQLFAESNGRFLVEVEPDKASRFETTVPAAKVGFTNDSDRLKAGSLLNADLAELKTAWQQPLNW